LRKRKKEDKGMRGWEEKDRIVKGNRWEEMKENGEMPESLNILSTRFEVHHLNMQTFMSMKLAFFLEIISKLMKNI
jgi:hypothetical protein